MQKIKASLEKLRRSFSVWNYAFLCSVRLCGFEIPKDGGLVIPNTLERVVRVSNLPVIGVVNGL